jgi:hypothetical protein
LSKYCLLNHPFCNIDANNALCMSCGLGPVIVILPSLGREVEDYDIVASRLVSYGFRVSRSQPRDIGASTGPLTGLTLHD